MSKRKLRCVLMRVLLVLLLVLTPLTFGQGGRSDPSFIYGVWRIQRVQEVGGHAIDSARANREVGRELEFDRKSMSYQKELLFLGTSCRRANYSIKKQKVGTYDVGEKGTLEFYDLAPKRPGWIEYVIVKCDDRAEYYFERAKGNSLAIYSDGWFFFLQKVGRGDH